MTHGNVAHGEFACVRVDELSFPGTPLKLEQGIPAVF